MEMNEEEIKDRLTKTCVCRQVTRAKIKAAIMDGADTMEKVKAKTGAMSGSCHGRKCKGSIEDLLARYKEEGSF
ncbi:(2Fe-2S)-binding protein [Cellulosilyticum sp. ST5]